MRGVVGRRLHIWALALIISFVSAAPALAVPPSAEEMRAVISTWRNVRQMIEHGAPVNRRVPVYYHSRFQLNRLTWAQERKILDWARQADLWRDPWFIIVYSIR